MKALLFLAFAAVASAQDRINLGRVVPAPPVNPVMHVEQVALLSCPSPATLPCTPLPAGTGATYTYALQAGANLMASMGMIVTFASSQVGADVNAPQPTATPTITLTLPTYSPFTALDIVTVTYWATK